MYLTFFGFSLDLPYTYIYKKIITLKKNNINKKREVIVLFRANQILKNIK